MLLTVSVNEAIVDEYESTVPDNSVILTSVSPTRVDNEAILVVFVVILFVFLLTLSVKLLICEVCDATFDNNAAPVSVSLTPLK